jgi:hypothetical protein
MKDIRMIAVATEAETAAVIAVHHVTVAVAAEAATAGHDGIKL